MWGRFGVTERLMPIHRQSSLKGTQDESKPWAFARALRLQQFEEAFIRETFTQVMTLSEEQLEALDPSPNIHSLFMHYQGLYFDNKLGACSVEWSTSRMTLCAGVCHYEKSGGCRIKLSEPLLKFRPTRELKETLLHEMIHAYLFLTKERDGDHGPQFQAKMNFINSATFPDPQRPSSGGYHITVYHSLHAEVDQYRTHHWQCERCGNLLKRAMNRPPQPADCRGRSGRGVDCTDVACLYHMHLKHCGGQYTKVAEPEGFAEKRSKSKAKAVLADGTTVVPAKRPRHNPAITDFFGRIVNDVQDTSEPANSTHAAPSNSTPQPVLEATAERPGTSNPMHVEIAQQSRQLLGDAALRRLEVGSGGNDASMPCHSGQPALSGSLQHARPPEQQVQEQHNAFGMSQQQPSSTAAVDDVVVLLSHEDEVSRPFDDSSRAHACGNEVGRLTSVECATMTCPICGRAWLGGTITNTELNNHIDQCLL